MRVSSGRPGLRGSHKVPRCGGGSPGWRRLPHAWHTPPPCRTIPTGPDLGKGSRYESRQSHAVGTPRQRHCQAGARRQAGAGHRSPESCLHGFRHGPVPFTSFPPSIWPGKQKAALPCSASCPRICRDAIPMTVRVWNALGEPAIPGQGGGGGGRGGSGPGPSLPPPPPLRLAGQTASSSAPTPAVLPHSPARTHLRSESVCYKQCRGLVVHEMVYRRRKGGKRAAAQCHGLWSPAVRQDGARCAPRVDGVPAVMLGACLLDHALAAREQRAHGTKALGIGPVRGGRGLDAEWMEVCDGFQGNSCGADRRGTFERLGSGALAHAVPGATASWRCRGPPPASVGSFPGAQITPPPAASTDPALSSPRHAPPSPALGSGAPRHVSQHLPHSLLLVLGRQPAVDAKTLARTWRQRGSAPIPPRRPHAWPSHPAHVRAGAALCEDVMPACSGASIAGPVRGSSPPAAKRTAPPGHSPPGPHAPRAQPHRAIHGAHEEAKHGPQAPAHDRGEDRPDGAVVHKLLTGHLLGGGHVHPLVRPESRGQGLLRRLGVVRIRGQDLHCRLGDIAAGHGIRHGGTARAGRRPLPCASTHPTFAAPRAPPTSQNTKLYVIGGND